MDDNSLEEAGQRLREAFREIDDLCHRIDGLAARFELGDVRSWPSRDTVMQSVLTHEDVTDEEIRDAARDLLAHANLSLGVARVGIERDGDAAGAIGNVIRAARIYGHTTCLLMSWQHGVRPLRAMLGEAQRIANEQTKNLDDGRKKGAEKNRQKSRQAQELARHWALIALGEASHQPHNGIPIGSNLNARAAWVAERLEAAGLLQANGKLYAPSTIRGWIAGI